MVVAVHFEGRSTETDADLIARACRSPESFAEVIDRHYQPIYAYAARRLGPDLAEDVASETFLVAFDRRSGYDLARDDARPWLYGIASNLIARHGRAESRRYKSLARGRRPRCCRPARRPRRRAGRRRMVDGKLVVDHQGRGSAWAYIPYRDLARLTTPEAVLAWEKAPKGVGANLDAVLSQYVPPPAVEAAFFRAIARGEGVALNPDTVNLDGDLRIREGDLFRLAIYTASVIVDRVGDTR